MSASSRRKKQKSRKLIHHEWGKQVFSSNKAERKAQKRKRRSEYAHLNSIRRIFFL